MLERVDVHVAVQVFKACVVYPNKTCFQSQMNKLHGESRGIAMIYYVVDLMYRFQKEFVENDVTWVGTAWQIRANHPCESSLGGNCIQKK